MGNYWDDFESNFGFPYHYEIPGQGSGMDWYPNRFCEDKTVIGTCSINKPLYCEARTYQPPTDIKLVNNCKYCGCPINLPYCFSDGTCKHKHEEQILNMEYILK